MVDVVNSASELSNIFALLDIPEFVLIRKVIVIMPRIGYNDNLRVECNVTSFGLKLDFVRVEDFQQRWKVDSLLSKVVYDDHVFSLIVVKPLETLIRKPVREFIFFA